MTDEIHIDERAIEAIQGDPERTICLVVTPDKDLSNQSSAQVRKYLEVAFEGTKWEGICVLVQPPGWKLEAVNMPAKQAAEMQALQESQQNVPPFGLVLMDRCMTTEAHNAIWRSIESDIAGSRFDKMVFQFHGASEADQRLKRMAAITVELEGDDMKWSFQHDGKRYPSWAEMRLAMEVKAADEPPVKQGSWRDKEAML